MNRILSYEKQGQGIPILCLHGHPGSKDCMEVFTTPLSDHWQTISPDLRGYGQSKTQSKFEMEDHLTDIVQLLDSLKIEQCILLGWSLGGIVSMELAMRYPQRVKGMILVASSAHPVSSHPKVGVLDLLWTIIAGIINRVRPGVHWNIQLFGRRSLFQYLIQTHNTQTYQYLAGVAWKAFFQTSKFAHGALNQAIARGYNKLEQVGQITCPTLVLAAECDRHITAKSSHKTQQQIPNSDWILYEQVAHLFPWEIPEQVNHDIAQWLEKHF